MTPPADRRATTMFALALVILGLIFGDWAFAGIGAATSWAVQQLTSLPNWLQFATAWVISSLVIAALNYAFFAVPMLHRNKSAQAAQASNAEDVRFLAMNALMRRGSVLGAALLGGAAIAIYYRLVAPNPHAKRNCAVAAVICGSAASPIGLLAYSESLRWIGLGILGLITLTVVGYVVWNRYIRVSQWKY